MGQAGGPTHTNWKGDAVGYSGLHTWMKRHYPRTGRCQRCGCGSETRRIDLANLDHTYRRDLEDWAELCTLCHYHHDRELPTHCPSGHPYDDANTYYSRERRQCRACARERYHRTKQLRGYPKNPCAGCGCHPDDRTRDCMTCTGRHWRRTHPKGAL